MRGSTVLVKRNYTVRTGHTDQRKPVLCFLQLFTYCGHLSCVWDFFLRDFFNLFELIFFTFDQN